MVQSCGERGRKVWLDGVCSTPDDYGLHGAARGSDEDVCRSRPLAV